MFQLIVAALAVSYCVKLLRLIPLEISGPGSNVFWHAVEVSLSVGAALIANMTRPWYCPLAVAALSDLVRWVEHFLMMVGDQAFQKLQLRRR